MPSKDVIALIARQWAATSDEEKLLWKERAVAENSARNENEGLAEGVAELIDGDEGDKGKKKRAAAKKPTPKVSAAV
jgi:membrane-bound ClpP family serine protease